MNGHSDVLMGACVTNSPELEEKLRFVQNGKSLCYHFNQPFIFQKSCAHQCPKFKFRSVNRASNDFRSVFQTKYFLTFQHSPKENCKTQWQCDSVESKSRKAQVKYKRRTKKDKRRTTMKCKESVV